MRYHEIRLVETVILRELSDKIKQATRDRFKQDDPTLNDQQINFYLDRWDRYAPTFPVESRDITRLTFPQVEQLIDAAETRAQIKGGGGTDRPDTSAEDTLYDQNNLVILRGDMREKCITYGKGYRWCISATDASNKYNWYRMNKNAPVFYFVFDRDRPKTNPWHAVVIFVDTRGTYHVDLSDNPGDKPMSWQQIVTQQPKLHGLQGLFKSQPLTSKEKADYAKYGQAVDDATYAAWPITDQYAYIQFGHPLTPEQQSITAKNLIGTYAKYNPTRISPETWDRLNPSDQRAVEKGRLALVSESGENINDIIDAGIVPSDQVQIAAIRQYTFVLDTILAAGIKPSEAVQLALIEEAGGEEIKVLLDAGIIPSEQVQLAAVEQNGRAIRFIIGAGIEPSKAVQQAADDND